uniref:Uncharacterized protein n=1 Tax=Anguilla anguilla TaxID=7936 RepID=A0A0E9S1X4_ANGAN
MRQAFYYHFVLKMCQLTRLLWALTGIFLNLTGNDFE